MYRMSPVSSLQVLAHEPPQNFVEKNSIFSTVQNLNLLNSALLVSQFRINVTLLFPYVYAYEVVYLR